MRSVGASVTSVLIVSCAETGLVTALRQNDGPSEPINHPLSSGTRSLRQAAGRANGLGVNIVPNPSCPLVIFCPARVKRAR